MVINMGNFRFVILGAGKIAGRFCNAVNLSEDCQVAAVASKSYERAQSFAAQHGLTAFYDSYEEMLTKEKPDCAYIAVTADAHFALTMLCLSHHVPVICEKAMFLNSNQAREAFCKAKEEKLFVMEATWSRFLPAVNQVREWLSKEIIGNPTWADMRIGFVAPEGADNRYFNPKLGGGAAFDITIYAYEIITWLIEKPIKNMYVSAYWGATGVDVTDHILLEYPDMMASLQTSFAAPMEERLVIYGREGRIVLPRPHVASEALLFDKTGNLLEHFQDVITQNGFVYQIAEVMRCIREGRLESSVVPHSATLDCAEVFDRIMETRPIDIPSIPET